MVEAIFFVSGVLAGALFAYMVGYEYGYARALKDSRR